MFLKGSCRSRLFLRHCVTFMCKANTAGLFGNDFIHHVDGNPSASFLPEFVCGDNVYSM